jgi:ATP-dependent Lon protease
VAVTPKNLESFLGAPPFKQETPDVRHRRGHRLGLDRDGRGDARHRGHLVHTKNRGFKLTGQLGEVMQESAKIAYSYISAHLKSYQAVGKFFDEAFVHLHVPEGATPKDGPSAGITMATALLSLALGPAHEIGRWP